jgi:hypothetical protein
MDKTSPASIPVLPVIADNVPVMAN